MRSFFWIACLWLVTAVLEYAVLPEFLPDGWHLDLGLWIALAAVVLCPLEMGLAIVFVFGLQADLLGPEQMGVHVVCYMAAAALMQLPLKDLIQWGVIGVWSGILLGVLLVFGGQGLFQTFSKSGAKEWSLLSDVIFEHFKTAGILGLPFSIMMLFLFRWTNILSVPVLNYLQIRETTQRKKSFNPRTNVPRTVRSMRDTVNR